MIKMLVGIFIYHKERVCLFLQDQMYKSEICNIMLAVSSVKKTGTESGQYVHCLKVKPFITMSHN